MMDIACVQTSPISFVARGKEPFSACNKGNRRRLHAGNDGDGFINLKKKTGPRIDRLLGGDFVDG